MITKSVSRVLLRISAGTALCLAAYASAEPPKVGAMIPVQIEVLGSPTAQINKCERMRGDIASAPDDAARIQRALEVIANLDVVRRAWPKTTDAIVDAALMQYDIAMEFNMPRNAVDALAAALPSVKKSRHEPRLEYRLGAAYEAAGDLSAAESHYHAAEKSAHFKLVDRIEADDALQHIAMFYARQNKPRESLKRFRAAADLDGQSPTLKVLHRFAALKEAVRLSDDAGRDEAKREAQALRDAIKDAKDKTKNKRSSSDAVMLTDVERDMQRVLSEVGL
jgi:tetratricopeptide (TPR) repeat protein